MGGPDLRPLLSLPLPDRGGHAAASHNVAEGGLWLALASPSGAVTAQTRVSGVTPARLASSGWTACGGRVPRDARRARVRDGRGERREASVAFGVWLAVLVGPEPWGALRVDFFDAGGTHVGRAPTEGLADGGAHADASGTADLADVDFPVYGLAGASRGRLARITSEGPHISGVRLAFAAEGAVTVETRFEAAEQPLVGMVHGALADRVFEPPGCGCHPEAFQAAMLDRRRLAHEAAARAAPLALDVPVDDDRVAWLGLRAGRAWAAAARGAPGPAGLAVTVVLTGCDVTPTGLALARVPDFAPFAPGAGPPAPAAHWAPRWALA